MCCVVRHLVSRMWQCKSTDEKAHSVGMITFLRNPAEVIITRPEKQLHNRHLFLLHCNNSCTVFVDHYESNEKQNILQVLRCSSAICCAVVCITSQLFLCWPFARCQGAAQHRHNWQFTNRTYCHMADDWTSHIKNISYRVRCLMRQSLYFYLAIIYWCIDEEEEADELTDGFTQV